jgi:hypothetical protein
MTQKKYQQSIARRDEPWPRPPASIDLSGPATKKDVPAAREFDNANSA